MTRIITPNFAVANSITKNVLQRMARFDLYDRLELIGNEFGKIGFRTSFSLADQILTHALLTSHSNVEFVIDLDAVKSNNMIQSLQRITQETYGLDLKRCLSSDVKIVLTSSDVGEYSSKDKVRNLLAINPLADWDTKKLIEYVLAHEVPVDPADIHNLQSLQCKQVA